MGGKFNKIIFLFFLVLICLIRSWNLNAQSTNSYPTFQFETFELPGGELGSNVQAIAQDSFGFMWFGSQFGLHRWDGYQFKTYLHNPKDTGSISGSSIENIYVGLDGTLWIGTRGNGLNRFHYETETFQRFKFNLNGVNSGDRNTIKTIAEYQNGTLWIGTGYGLIRMDTNSGKITEFLHDPNDPNSLSNNKCNVLLVDLEGILWVGTGDPFKNNQKGGLNRFRPETENFSHYYHNPKDTSTLIDNKITEIFEDSKNNLWIGTCGDGLHKMNRQTEQFQRLEQDPLNPNQLCGPFLTSTHFRHIRFIKEDQDYNLWIGALHGGIKYYNPKTGYIKDYYFEKNNSQSLPEGNPWEFFQSQDGTFWVSTNEPDGKVFKFNETEYESFYIPEKKDKVYSFCETTDQKIWIGTKNSGLLQFDPKTGQISPFQVKKINKQHGNFTLSDFQIKRILNYVIELVEDNKGQLWMRKYLPKGLFVLNPSTSEMRVYQHDPQDDKTLGKGSITDILKDKKDQIWMLTSRGDLNLYQPEKDQFVRYQFVIPKNPNIKFGYNFQMTETEEGKFWILGTSSWGEFMPPVLTLFDPSTGEFTSNNSLISAHNSFLQYEAINKILEDDFNNLWICTSSNLLKININTGAVSYIGASEFGGLYFKDMVMDDQKRIWLYGDKISIYNPVTNEKSNFVNNTNLQASSLLARCMFKDANGFIYLGGRGGFQIYNPMKVEKAQPISSIKTIIHRFQILNQQKDEKEEDRLSINVVNKSKVNLQYDQNAFTFRFAALEFQDSKSNHHEFKLEGYDKQWRLAGKEPVATYVKVPPGDYTFKVRGASLRDKWGAEETIHLHISSPWWATWWAYTLYSLIFLGLLYGSFYFQLNRKLDKAETRRLSELNKIKNRFYTNITHEFRTPLTVIMGMVEIIKGHSKEKELISRNSKSLLRLINQLLDSSKLDSGNLHLNYIHGDIVKYLEYLTESFISMADEKGIRLTFYSEVKELFVDYDEKKIQHIVYNLLSNAIKFTSEDGKVILHLRPLKKDGDVDWIQLKVSDTGVGISEENLPKIFKPYYQEDTLSNQQETGTGIGLAFTKELTEMLGGEILVESKFGVGTDFIVLLPIRKEKGTPQKEPDSLNTNSEMTTKVSTKNNIVPSGNSLLNKSPENPLVLIIEDNRDVATYIESLLKKDYTIEIARNGQIGIDKALEIIPDIIISDVMMPEKNGYEVCQFLKNDERSSHIPIILLTAKATAEDRIEGLKEGADAYLIKPFNKEELFIRLEKLVEVRKALQEHFASNNRNIKSKSSDLSTSLSLDERFLQKLSKVVEEKLNDNDLAVVHLCRAVNLSNMQVNRKLKALTGKTPSRFIRSIRLQKAIELLQTTELNISEIAYEVGFSEPNYFSRVFSEEFGYPPNVIRK